LIEDASTVGDTLQDCSASFASIALVALVLISESTLAVHDAKVTSLEDFQSERSLSDLSLPVVSLLHSSLSIGSLPDLFMLNVARFDNVRRVVDDVIGGYNVLVTDLVHVPTLPRILPSQDFNDAYSLDDDDVLATLGDIFDATFVPLDFSNDNKSSENELVNDTVENDALSNRFCDIDERELKNIRKGN